MSKDIEYFIREAKDKIRREIPFHDYDSVLIEASLEQLHELSQAIKRNSSMDIGLAFNSIIDSYVDSQTGRIDCMAAQMLRDYQEDCKAEADEARHSAKHGG